MKGKGLLAVMLAGLLIVTMLVISCGPAAAPTEEFPEKDIRLICPWGVGGGADAISRKIASLTEVHLPVSMYVENVEGGFSGNALYELVTSEPDGYNLMSITYDCIITVVRQGLLPGFDIPDLKLVCLVTAESDALVVRSDTPWNTLEEMINDAKSRPGEIVISTGGALGSKAHLTGLALENASGAKFTFIPATSGAAPQKEALLNKEADGAINSLGDFADMLETDQVRPLSNFSEVRNPKYDNVPTALEAGYDVLNGSFVIVVAPKEIPDDRVAILEEAFSKAQHSSEFQDWAKSIGIEAPWQGSADVGPWALQFQANAFKMMDDLVAAGVLQE